MKVVRTVAELRRAAAARPVGARVGFVPTMGALHRGHEALFRAARADSEIVVASIFVNPLQFDDSSDFGRYPRPEAEDAEIARGAGVDLLFTPTVDEIYPSDHATSVSIEGAARGFEGDVRPGHYNGVALVCLKLFNLVAPAVVYLGQKDAQQVAVLRQLVRDTNLMVEIRVVPTVRDVDGLALSSRNERLSAEERRRASAIPKALAAGLDAYRQGADPVKPARALLSSLAIDYVAVAFFDRRPTLVVAVRAGTTRLIDNVPLDHPELAGLTSSTS